MRSIAVAGLMLAAILSLAAAGPAAAGGDGRPYYGRAYPGDVGRNYQGTGIYVHNHMYAPPSIRNVYAIHTPGPYHIHVVRFGNYPYVWYNARGGYFAPPLDGRRYWQWRAGYRRW
jgi:hypothetical protein